MFVFFAVQRYGKKRYQTILIYNEKTIRPHAGYCSSPFSSCWNMEKRGM